MLGLLALPLILLGAAALGPMGSDSAAADEAGEIIRNRAPSDPERALFPLCGGGRRVTCVVDGDTIWLRGSKIRLADIDTPEVARPGCAREAELGRRAAERLRDLLNAGPFTLAPNPNGRSTDRYGRALHVIERGGQSIGQVLVNEGLASRWGGPRRTWC